MGKASQYIPQTVERSRFLRSRCLAIRLDSNRSAGIRAWLIYYRGVNIARIHTDVFAIKFDHDYAISLKGGGAVD